MERLPPRPDQLCLCYYGGRVLSIFSVVYETRCKFFRSLLYAVVAVIRYSVWSMIIETKYGSQISKIGIFRVIPFRRSYNCL